MHHQRCVQNAPERGVALMITLIFLAMFACLAVAIASSADMTYTVSRNRIQSQQAGAAAEVGLQLAQKHLGGLVVPGTSAEALHQAIAEKLQTQFAGVTMVDAGSIAWDEDGVSVPPMTLARADGQTCQVCLGVAVSNVEGDTTTVTLTSVGAYGSARRTARYNMTVQRGGGLNMAYGIASKSPVEMTGNACISGANNAAEGSILSATYSTDRAIRMTGNCSTSGDAAVCNPDGEVRKVGNCTVGGEEIIGAAEPTWPEVDPSVFLPYATNVRSSGSSANIVLSNIIIPPNSNPTFSGNTTIYGVVYVQAPNKVSFTGNTVLIGCVICEEPTVDNLNANQIKFTGNLSTSGVENLPAGSQYDGLRELTGSFLLAPGFSAEFTGNFSTVNGCMVASEFKFTGNAGGRIKGGAVNLRDSQFQMTGNANLVIDRENAVANPAGLVSSYQLVCVSGSYSE
jgi:Tfp pilus assembly protein PilX